MSLNHLTRAQAHLKTRLPDTCTISAPDVRGTFNTTTGVYGAATPGAESYDGPCSVSESAGQAPTLEQAGQNLQLASHTVRVPADAPTPDLGDVVTITGSEVNPSLVGLTFTVVGVREATHQVSKIIGCRTRERSPLVP